MDNYQFFCDFFELPSAAGADKQHQDYELLLRGFKTLFPKYVFENEQI